MHKKCSNDEENIIKTKNSIYCEWTLLDQSIKGIPNFFLLSMKFLAYRGQAERRCTNTVSFFPLGAIMIYVIKFYNNNKN